MLLHRNINFSRFLWLKIVATLSSLSLLYFQESNDVRIHSDDENRLELTFDNDCFCRRNEKIVVEQVSLKEYRVNLNNNRSYKIDLNEERMFRVGCDLRKALRRGRNQRVVAYSLFSDDSVMDAKYTDLLTHLTHKIHNHFPDWIIRIYYDGSDRRIMSSLVCSLECASSKAKYLNNVDFCDINKLPFESRGTRDLTGESAKRFWSAKYIHSMIWRWLPIGDSLVDAFMSRDTDSTIVQRELDSVHVWLSSNRSGHIMRGGFVFFIYFFLLSFLLSFAFNFIINL